MTTIVTKNGSGAPLASDLVQGELAVDLTNKRLYTENASGTVIEVGTNPSTLTVTGDLAVDTDTLFADASEDKVAINDATGRNSTLHINSATLSASIGLSASGTTTKDNQALVCSGDDLFFTTGATERMRIDSSGNVGIGTSDPSSFSIDTGPDIILGDGTDNPHLSIVSPTTGTGYVAFADGTAGTAKYSGLIEYAHSTDHMGLRTGGTERMRIDSSGNVGIGETAPSRALDIKSANPLNINTTSNNHIHFQVNDVTTGQYASSSSLPHQLCDSTGSSPRLVVDSSGRVGIGTSSPSTGVFSSYSDLVIGETTTSTSGISFKASSTGVSSIFFADADFNRSGQIQYSHTSDSLAFVTDNATAMSIDSSGNVGIGTSSPASALQIQDTLSADGALITIRDTRTRASGNKYGIDFRDSSNETNAFIATELTGSNNGSALTFRTNAGTGGNGVTSGSERMRIDSSGNLLVGTTAPQSGTGTAKQYVFNNTASQSCLQVTAGASHTGAYALAAFSTVNAASASNIALIAQSGNGSTITTNNFFVYTNGDVKNTNNSYGAISDARLKSNIVDASSQIDDIMAVQVRSYTLDLTGDTHIGVVAQELEEAGMSGLVQEDEEGMKSVKYSVLYIKAIKALQEAVTRIETLEAEVAALKGA